MGMEYNCNCKPMKRLQPALDRSLLSFLVIGDQTTIANEERENGKKTTPSYVSKVLSGKHRNDRILKRAFELALKRKSQFPQQALKV